MEHIPPELKDIIHQRILYLDELEQQLSKRIRSKSAGHLRISRGRYYFRKNPKDKTGVLIKDKVLASEVAQADYDKEVLKRVRQEKRFLEEFEQSAPKETAEQVYPNLNPQRQELITPVYLPDDEFVRQWLSVTWEPMGFRDGAPQYTTESGDRVRSKSELVMSNSFHVKFVPNRYEYPVYLEGRGWVRPDFVCLNVRTREEILWEHFGRMDDPDYARRAIAKLKDYQKNGYYLGENLIVTMETSGNELDPEEINRWIERKLL